MVKPCICRMYINMKYKRVGHLFQGRFKSILIEAETHLHVLTLYSSKSGKSGDSEISNRV